MRLAPQMRKVETRNRRTGEVVEKWEVRAAVLSVDSSAAQASGDDAEARA